MQGALYLLCQYNGPINGVNPFIDRSPSSQIIEASTKFHEQNPQANVVDVPKALNARAQHIMNDPDATPNDIMAVQAYIGGIASDLTDIEPPPINGEKSAALSNSLATLESYLGHVEVFIDTAFTIPDKIAASNITEEQSDALHQRISGQFLGLLEEGLSLEEAQQLSQEITKIAADLEQGRVDLGVVATHEAYAEPIVVQQPEPLPEPAYAEVENGTAVLQSFATLMAHDVGAVNGNINQQTQDGVRELFDYNPQILADATALNPDNPFDAVDEVLVQHIKSDPEFRDRMLGNIVYILDDPNASANDIRAAQTIINIGLDNNPTPVDGVNGDGTRRAYNEFSGLDIEEAQLSSIENQFHAGKNPDGAANREALRENLARLDQEDALAGKFGPDSQATAIAAQPDAFTP